MASVQGAKSASSTIRYQPDESPPHPLAAALGAQSMLLTVANIALVPTIVVRASGIDGGYMSWAVFAALVVSGISTLLQAFRIGRVGSGCILLMGTSGAFISVSVTALADGGPGLLATLVLISSLVQFVVSERLSWLRRVFTPTVAGTVIMLVAVAVMPIVFDMLKTPEGTDPAAVPVTASVTLAAFIMIALRGTGVWRLIGPVIAIAIGCAVSAWFGLYDTTRVAQAPWFGLPEAGWPGLDFRFGPEFWHLLPAFIFVTVVGAIETVGDAIAIQRVSWRDNRAIDFRAVQGAVAADGVGNLISGLLATVPNTTYSQTMSLVQLTGVAARTVGVYIGICFIAIAFLSKVLAAIAAIPDAVAGAYLLVFLAMLFVLGMEVIIQDGVDYRKSVIVGTSFWVGSGFQYGLIFPEVLGNWTHLLENGMVAGGICAIVMTLFVELTSPRTWRMETKLDSAELKRINEFLDGLVSRYKWGGKMKMQLQAATEEAVLALAHQEDVDAAERRLRLSVRGSDAGAELEFIAGGLEGNLEDRLASVSESGEPEGRDLSLRLLRHYASEVHHKQYHDVDIVNIHVDLIKD